MGFTGVDNNIYSLNTVRPNFGGFTAKKPVTSPVKTPEIKDTFTKRTDRANDGKFSALEFGKNLVKGTGQFFTDIYHGIVKNPYVSVPLIILTGAIAASPVGMAILAGGGIFAAAFSGVFLGVKAISSIMDKNWDDLEKQGKDLGKLIPGAILSGMGAVHGIKLLRRVAGLDDKVGVANCIRKAGELDMFTMTAMKDVALSPFRRGLRGPLKTHWEKFVTADAKKTGNFFTKITNFLFRPNINDKLFHEKELTHLLNAAKRENFFTNKGFIDLKFGFGKDGAARNFFQSLIMALRGRAAE